ncbi:MAG: Uma2 family endonuclease [Planctomycetota bacterium JB042]
MKAMSLSPDTTRHWTYADYCALPDDGRRYQIVEGELFVNPAPIVKHQAVLLNLYAALRVRAEREGGLCLASPIDVLLADDTVVQPDLVYLAKARRPAPDAKNLTEAPDLVVEVLSPSTRRLDVVRKRAVYAGHGVREFWIVDPELDRVEVLVADGRGGLEARPPVSEGAVRSEVVLPGFEVPIDELFRV